MSLQPNPGRILKAIPGAFEQITVSSTAIGLTPPTAASYGGGTVYAYITVETANVRWRDDRTVPTTAIGHTLAAGERLGYDGDVNDISFIRDDAVDAVLNVSYYVVS